jgi:hypothetical protein
MQPSGRRALALAATLTAALVSQMLAGAVLAAETTILSADFSGGAGTALVGGTLFAKSGAALTLTVVTDSAAMCVSLSGAHAGSTNTPASTTSTSQTWIFALLAVSGPDGVRATTIASSTDPGCLTADATASLSYTIDNTPPTLSSTKSPLPNAFNWSNSNVTITWSASDSGSGIASGPTPATDTQTTETPGVLKTSTAMDSVGNVGTGSVLVRLDKTPPSVIGTANPLPNANGWNNSNVTISFTCSDGRSGIRSCPASATFTANTAGQLITGTAVDFASNSTSVSVGPINIDKNAPTLSGAPLGSPNGAGWYNSEVEIAWTCTDTGGANFASGACDDSIVAGDGFGLTASKVVTDRAGNSSLLAVSSPAVNIDQTAPEISALAVPQPNGAGWNNTDVTVTFSCADATSGIVACPGDMQLSSDGAGQAVSGTTYDAAGNSASTTAFASIDMTPPAVTVTGVVNGGTYLEGGYSAGCSTVDALSGVASPATMATSGGPTGSVMLSCAGAVDLAGNAQAFAVVVTINVTAPATYAFGGFVAPVRGGDVVNSVRAGAAIPVKFSLGGYQGTTIFAAGYPTSAAYACAITPSWLAGESTVTANVGLTYDATADMYVYVWKTNPSWTGCRVLQLLFTDGSSARAYFRFR